MLSLKLLHRSPVRNEKEDSIRMHCIPLDNAMFHTLYSVFYKIFDLWNRNSLFNNFFNKYSVISKSLINDIILITNYWLPITDYQLLITNYQLPITNYQLPITDYQLLITDYQLLNTVYKSDNPYKTLFAIVLHFYKNYWALIPP